MALLGLLVVLGALGAIGGSVSARETNLAHTASVRTEVAMMEQDAAHHAMPMMAMAAPAMDMAFKRSMPMADMPAGSSRGMPGGGGANIMMGSAATSAGGGGGNSGLDEVVADMAASATATGGGPSVETPRSPLIIKDGSVSASVPSVSAALARVESLVKAAGGHIESSNAHEDEGLKNAINAAARRAAELRGDKTPPADHVGPTSAHAQVRVPAGEFENVLAAFRDAVASIGGRVQSESSNARDATAEFVDVAARQAVLEQSRVQMGKVLAAARSVQDVLMVRRELERIQSDLDATISRRKWLETRAAMSSLSVSLNTPWPSHPPPPPREPKRWSPWATLLQALGSLLTLGMLVVDGTIFAVVYLVPVGVVAAAVWTAAGWLRGSAGVGAGGGVSGSAARSHATVE